MWMWNFQVHVAWFYSTRSQADAAAFTLSASQDGLGQGFAIKTLFPNFNEHYGHSSILNL